MAKKISGDPIDDKAIYHSRPWIVRCWNEVCPLRSSLRAARKISRVHDENKGNVIGAGKEFVYLKKDTEKSIQVSTSILFCLIMNFINYTYRDYFVDFPPKFLSWRYSRIFHWESS